MRIAICSNEPSLDSLVNSRFGRCPHFIVVDENGQIIEILANDSIQHSHGAGISSAQLLINYQVDTILAGRVGPKAFKPLQLAGINIYTGISGTVVETYQSFQSGELPLSEQYGV